MVRLNAIRSQEAAQLRTVSVPAAKGGAEAARLGDVVGGDDKVDGVGALGEGARVDDA